MLTNYSSVSKATSLQNTAQKGSDVSATFTATFATNDPPDFNRKRLTKLVEDLRMMPGRGKQRGKCFHV